MEVTSACPMRSNCKLQTDASHCKKYSHGVSYDVEMSDRIKFSNTNAESCSDSGSNTPPQQSNMNREQNTLNLNSTPNNVPPQQSYTNGVPNNVPPQYLNREQNTVPPQSYENREQNTGSPQQTYMNRDQNTQSYANRDQNIVSPQQSYANREQNTQSYPSSVPPQQQSYSNSIPPQQQSYPKSVPPQQQSYLNTTPTQQSYTNSVTPSYPTSVPPQQQSYSNMSHSYTSNVPTVSHNLPHCPYGASCQLLQVIPDHSLYSYHPPVDNRPICPYGATCQLLAVSPEHRLQVSHTAPENVKKKVCPYSQTECKLLLSDPTDHPKEFIHLQPCPHGFDCAFKSESQHSEKYTHPDKPTKKVSCPNGQGCKMLSDHKHCEKYTHDNPASINPTPKENVAKVVCHEGSTCLLFLSGDKNHAQRFSHDLPKMAPPGSPTIQMGPPMAGQMGSPIVAPLPPCEKGVDCAIVKTSASHAKKYDHTGPPIVQSNTTTGGGGGNFGPPVNKPMCSNSRNCNMTSDYAHKQQFLHFCRNGKNCKNINDPVHLERFVH